MAAHGHFGWNELNTHDAESAKRFGEAAFGWTWDGMPMPDGSTYWIAKSGDGMAAGLFPLSGPHFDNVPDHWLAYLAVDDVDARTAKVAETGGSVVRAPWTVADVGRLSIVKLPGGAIMGLMETRSDA